MLRCVLAMVMVACLAVVAEAQCRNGVCQLLAPVADKAPVRSVVKALPKPIWGITRPVRQVAEAAVHTARATVKAVVLSHSYRTTAHERGCAMCLGQHLRNFHGKTYDMLDRLGFRNWVKRHEALHDEGVYEGPAVCTGPECSGGRVGILGRFRR